MRKEQKKINGLKFKLVEYKTIACRIDRRAGSGLVEICIFATYGNRDGCQRNARRTLHKRFSYCCMIAVLLCIINIFLYLCIRNHELFFIDEN
nr:MAG TPA: hypothetical protein [Bacteriophage sp.]